MKITWLGHSSVAIEAKEAVIVIDPSFESYMVLPRAPLSDIILISHWHADHATLDSVNKVRKDDTVIFGPVEAAREINGCRGLRVGQKVMLKNTVPLEVVPSRTVIRKGHREEGLGFVLMLEGKKIYYAGDTEPLAELANMQPDIAFLPVGGTTTMGPKEAARYAKQLGAKLVVPVHYGRIEGTVENAELFAELCTEQGIRSRVLTAFRSFEYVTGNPS